MRLSKTKQLIKALEAQSLTIWIMKTKAHNNNYMRETFSIDYAFRCIRESSIARCEPIDENNWKTSERKKKFEQTKKNIVISVKGFWPARTAMHMFVCVCSSFVYRVHLIMDFAYLILLFRIFFNDKFLFFRFEYIVLLSLFVCRTNISTNYGKNKNEIERIHNMCFCVCVFIKFMFQFPISKALFTQL